MLPRIAPFTRLLLMTALVAVFAGCDATTYKIPPDQKATPVAPIIVAIDLSSDKTVLNSEAEEARATLHLVAYRADTWEPLPDGTDVSIVTNLGNLQSQAGPQELEVELFNGEVNSFFYPGEELGIARITATVLGISDLVEIEIR